MKKVLVLINVLIFAGCGMPGTSFRASLMPVTGRFSLPRVFRADTPLTASADFNPVLQKKVDSRKQMRLIGIKIRPGDQRTYQDSKIPAVAQDHIPYYEQHEAGTVLLAVSPGSIASEAGLKKDDIIVMWNDEDILSSTDLVNAVLGTKPDEEVKISVFRWNNDRTRGDYKDIRLALPSWDNANHIGVLPYFPFLYEHYYNYFYWKTTTFLWVMHFEGLRNYKYYRVIPFILGKEVEGSQTTYDFIFPWIWSTGGAEPYWL